MGAPARRRTLALALGAALALAASACGPRVVRTPVFEEEGTSVYLRHRERRGQPLARGFDHPGTISAVRLTNILSRIDVREKEGEGERRPAIPTALLYTVGDGLSRALAKADPSQEVVVMAIERRRHLGIFTNDYLTSLVAWVEGDRLHLHLGVLEWPVPKDSSAKLPEPRTDRLSKGLRALPADGIEAVGTQTVAAAWRDPIFRGAGAVRVRPGGQVIRRTILLESAPEEPAAEPDAAEAPPPAGLSPDALRALADLEEARRRGELSEAAYRTRRRQILSGDSEPEAAAPAPPR